MEFGADIGSHQAAGRVVHVSPPSDATGWAAHGLGGDAVQVYVEDGRIVAMACQEQCWLRGRNLIGLSYDAVREWIGAQPEGEPDRLWMWDEFQDVFEFEDLSAQVWVSDGIVVTIIVSA